MKRKGMTLIEILIVIIIMIILISLLLPAINQARQSAQREQESYQRIQEELDSRESMGTEIEPIGLLRIPSEDDKKIDVFVYEISHNDETFLMFHDGNKFVVSRAKRNVDSPELKIKEDEYAEYPEYTIP